MRRLLIVVTLALSAVWATQAQIADPIPAPVAKRGLRVEINIVREGGNYGWMRREAIFDNNRQDGMIRMLVPE